MLADEMRGEARRVKPEVLASHMTFVILNSPCQAGLSSSATFATESTFSFLFDAMKLKSRKLLMTPTISTINSNHLMIGAGLAGAF